MSTDLYPEAKTPIRDDILQHHARALQHIAAPGAWFSGTERVAIAAETRLALECPFCQTRKDALSPNAVSGDHTHGGVLSETLVEVIHRITTDPARLSRSWYEGILAAGLADAAYVEAVSVVIHTISLDTFARGIGLAPRPLPKATDGAPSGYRPASARHTGAYVPVIPPGDEFGDEADIYDGMIGANVQQALTLVPDEQRSWFKLVSAQYLASAQMRDFDQEPRAITHAQMEFLAGRISALNQCLY
ncbi:MAG: hypothetical protein HOJ21_06110 [Alphaproteobacteria bacterium]|jgi:hypothetical protein|nr:hypothetical protein [Alphaproteobacteria bacterium]